uniref:Uncharacterized protein n=1 Tax=Pristionchus pacificus TaxID=54126 RepID=A0A2A6C297_PRIPA|eukprot:PDM72295.1 hypothetical protein PRIPAC_38729 [Pristionchus pacificus]
MLHSLLLQLTKCDWSPDPLLQIDSHLLYPSQYPHNEFENILTTCGPVPTPPPPAYNFLVARYSREKDVASEAAFAYEVAAVDVLLELRLFGLQRNPSWKGRKGRRGWEGQGQEMDQPLKKETASSDTFLP